MKQPCLREYLFRHLFPWPRSHDPKDWTEFVTARLVPEVRQETVRFYGPKEDEEAKWPGLDYTTRGHRLRLSAFPHHRHLFRAFDKLRLTDSEIYSLCRWEGTRYAKDKYNSSVEARFRIVDTTYDGVRDDNRPNLMPEGRRHPVSSRRGGSGSSGGTWHRTRGDRRSLGSASSTKTRYPAYDIIFGGDEHDDLDEHALEQSVGNELNQRLREATIDALFGHDAPVDPAYDEWLKAARESGVLAHPSGMPPLSAIAPASATPTRGGPPPTSPSRHRHRTQHAHYQHPPALDTQARQRAMPPPHHQDANTSRYWTQTVPEIFRYGSQNVYQTPALAHIAQTQRQTGPPPLYDQARRSHRSRR